MPGVICLFCRCAALLFTLGLLFFFTPQARLPQTRKAPQRPSSSPPAQSRASSWLRGRQWGAAAVSGSELRFRLPAAAPPHASSNRCCARSPVSSLPVCTAYHRCIRSHKAAPASSRRGLGFVLQEEEVVARRPRSGQAPALKRSHHLRLSRLATPLSRACQEPPTQCRLWRLKIRHTGSQALALS